MVLRNIKLYYCILFIFNSVYLISFLKKYSGSGLVYILFFSFLLILGIGSNNVKKVNLYLFLILLVVTISEYFTKRMTSFYFYEIPSEVINILYDTNIDEIKNNFYFSFKEWVGIILIVLNILMLFSLKKSVEERVFKVFLQIIFIFIFFLFYNNSIKSEIEFIINNQNLVKENIKILELRKSFKWNSLSQDKSPQTVVLFLGETHRGDYLSINGYSRETTPELEKRNVISFSDAISQGAYTLQSTPMILSRKNIYDSGLIPESSIISAFKEAGFTTWYVSYLSHAHIGDNEINLIANEADHYIQSDVNINTLDKILNDDSQKKLIVYKTVGSHYLYHNRYPKEFNKFQPSFTDNDYKTPSYTDKEKLENSYANSILYSIDYQVSEFIDRLKKEKGLVSLSFISDHGTSIYDDGKSLYGGNTKGNYNIALFFWFNKEYIDKYPLDVEYLIENKDKKVTSYYFFDTLLHIGKINTKKIKGRSLFESPLFEKERLIKNKDIYNYEDLNP
ncbi:phosphoethanolamine transferase [Proteus mirabilis]